MKVKFDELKNVCRFNVGKCEFHRRSPHRCEEKSCPLNEKKVCPVCTGDGIGADETGWVKCTTCNGKGKNNE